MSDNWVVQNLENALETWNEKLAEIWQLITTTPQDFKGGGIWGVIVNINGAVQSIGLALLVLFFVAGMVKTCGSFTEVKKPEHALKLFVRFAIAKGAITYGIKDSMVAEMTDLNRNLMMSIDVIPVPTDEAVREAESRLLGVETNATNWQRRQNANNNFSAQLPYDIEQQRKEMKEFLDDLTTRDQRMMFAVLTMVHTADTKEQLDNDTEALLTTARKHLCQFGILKFQQLDGLNTAMPFGVRKIESFRTLTTESLAVFIPFRVQDICHTMKHLEAALDDTSIAG